MRGSEGKNGKSERRETNWDCIGVGVEEIREELCSIFKRFLCVSIGENIFKNFLLIRYRGTEKFLG